MPPKKKRRASRPPPKPVHACNKCGRGMDGKDMMTDIAWSQHKLHRCPKLPQNQPPPTFQLPPPRLPPRSPSPEPPSDAVFDHHAGYETDAEVDTEIDRTAARRDGEARRKRMQHRAAKYRPNLDWTQPSVNERAQAKSTALQLLKDDTAARLHALDGGIDEDDDLLSDVVFGAHPAPPDGNFFPPTPEEQPDEDADADADADSVHSSDLSISDRSTGDWNDEFFPNHDEVLDEVQRRHRAKWNLYSNNGYVEYSAEAEDDEWQAQRNDDIPPFYVAQISLMKILSESSGNDLKLFDRIMDWVIAYSEQHPNVWRHHSIHPNRTRPAMMTYIRDTFAASNLLPQPTEVPLLGGSGEDKATVVTFDFAAQVRKLVTDPELIADGNLLENHFDRDTWRPTKSYDELSDDDLISDINAGYLFHKGIEMYCNGPCPEGIDMILPCPILIFSDESHHDNHGGNKTTPVSCTLGVFNAAARAKYKFWFNMAFIPTLGQGKGKFKNTYDDEWVEGGKKRGRKTLTPDHVTDQRVQNHQRLYDAALAPFRKVCRDQGGVVFMYKGKRCLLKFYFLEATGDAKEYNIICNHYNSCRTKCICKDCTCSLADIVNKLPPTCRPITLADHHRAVEDAEYAALISQHQLLSVWNDLPIADIVEGVSGMTPYEPLHVFAMGTCADGAQCIHDLIHPSVSAKKAEKESLDILFGWVGFELGRNSERDRPPFVKRTGANDGARMTGDEKVGNYMVQAICLDSARGRQIMRPHLEKRGPGNTNLRPDDMVETMCLVLAFQQWTRCPRTTKGELDNAAPAVADMMQRMVKFLPRPPRKKVKGSSLAGSHGYHKIKFHAIWKFLSNMRKFGSARGWDGQHGERFHKFSVKQNGHHTQKRPALFTQQVGVADGRETLIALAYDRIKHRCPLDLGQTTYDITTDLRRLKLDGSVTTQDRRNLYGLYALTVKAKSSRGNRRTFSHRWAWSQKNCLQESLSSDLLYALTDYEWPGELLITGYTELRTTSSGGGTVYRAAESYHGDKWYDWALVEDPVTRTTWIGQILGFVVFNTPGYPTYKLREVDGHSPEHIAASKMRDDTVYVVIRSSAEEFTEATLREKMFTHFKMMDDDRGTFVFPITCIKRPLMVVREFGATSCLSHISVLPMREWSDLFRAKIRSMATSPTLT